MHLRLPRRTFPTMTIGLMSREQFDEFDRAGREQKALAPIPWQKRMLDVALSLGLLLLLSPLIVLIAVGILLEGVLRPESKDPPLGAAGFGGEDLQSSESIRMDVYGRISREQKYLHIKPMERARTLSANVRETRSTQRIRVGRRQRKRTCWDCEREWKRMECPWNRGGQAKRGISCGPGGSR